MGSEQGASRTGASEAVGAKNGPQNVQTRWIDRHKVAVPANSWSFMEATADLPPDLGGFGGNRTARLE